MKKILEEGQDFTPQFEKRGGLLPVIVQEQNSGNVLMLGYANEAALQETLETGYATFWSTSRNELWTKGKTSGDYLKITHILTDCDQDALVYQVTMVGAGACHTKDEDNQARTSCFYRKVASAKTLEFIDK
ncbi:phosphoribosyl-AMP cyclohydrolase [uncultured Microscilla sp.]|uniref:phosphoribosyl-AMP cyclohydrolase n=1 Tax=uncultured Microscilla sp. TaxID=432653 RepID=UPI00260B9B6E|nr:phosphoribosyl-AMP cyclohydrolase [uncultured Microscilla sp.]